MSADNRQWKLRARPTAAVSRENFDFVTSPVPCQRNSCQVY